MTTHHRPLGVPPTAPAGRPAASRTGPVQACHPWTEGGVALLPAGRAWDAVKLPAATVHRVAAACEPDRVRGVLAELGMAGPVIHDPTSGVFYALVPPGTAPGWDAYGTECLGVACHIGVPDLTRTGPPGVHWLIPPDGDGTLCSPAAVRTLVTAALGPRDTTAP